MLELMNSVLDQIKGQAGWGPIVHVLVVVLATVAANLVQRALLARVARRLKLTKNPWDDAVVAALARPLSVLIWVVGVGFAAHIVGQASGSPVFAFVTPALTVGVVAVCAWFVLRLIRNIEELLVDADVSEVPTWDPTTATAIGKLLRLSIIISAVLVCMQSVGVNIAGLLAFGGIGGLAVGMAAKDLLANFFGGLMLYLDRPIAVGEWVRSPDRGIEGTVEEIGWRLTRIRTFDKRPLYIPNSMFTTIIVENPSRMSNRRIHETIGIRYDDLAQMSAITAAVEAMLRANPAIDTDQTLMVNFDSFGPSSVDFFVYTFTRTTVWTEFHAIKHDVLLAIHAIIAEHGAEIAFPTRTVHVPEGLEVKGRGEAATAPARA